MIFNYTNTLLNPIGKFQHNPHTCGKLWTKSRSNELLVGEFRLYGVDLVIESHSHTTKWSAKKCKW